MDEYAAPIGPKYLTPFGLFLQAIGLRETVATGVRRPRASASLRARRKRERQNRRRGRKP